MNKINKILAMAVVIAMACASIIIVSPNNTVMAEDSAKPLAELNAGYPAGIDKVAWHSDGSFALGIQSGTEHIYKYTRQTMSWASDYNLPVGDTFIDIKYSEFFDMFYIVGTQSGQQEAWSYDYSIQNLLDLNSPKTTMGVYNGLCLADEGGTQPYAFLAVGYADTSKGCAAWFDEAVDTWTDVTTGLTLNHELYDVTWDHGFTANPYWIVGEDMGTGAGVIYFMNSPGNNKANIFDTSGWGVTPGALNAIDWRPSGGADHAIMAGGNYGNGNVWLFDGFNGEAILDNTDSYTDACWHPDGGMAMVVGYNVATDGIIQHYIPDNEDTLTKMSTDGDYGPFYGVDVKAWSSPSSGLIVGATGAVGSYLSASDGSTTLTVNAAFPHIYDIDMWKTSDAGETSTLNARVDVEETYTFYTEVNYTIGGTDMLFDGINNTFVDLTAWFDDGNDATSMTPSASDDSHRTRKFVARFYETTSLVASGATGEIIYPDSTTNEILFDSVGCSGPYGADDRYGVWINVTFGPQMRAGDGQNFANGAAGSIFDSNQAFDDDDSWNFQMEVYDNDYPGATNTTYEEFGIFMATNITVSNNPSVNAPPGSVSQAFDSNSLITYSANIPYHVNVSIERLNLTTDDTKFIPASNVNASLVDMYPVGFDLEPYTEINATWGAAGRPFAAANTERMVWGNTSQATELVPAPNNGTAAHGPVYSNFNGYGATEVAWWINVPGATAEGIYQATITFKIGYY